VTETTLGQLFDSSAKARAKGQIDRALAGFAAVLAQQPGNLAARLRVSDCLLATGHAQEAALGYTALARHAAHAGHPLYTLVSIKVLTSLDPSLSKLVGALGGLYARGSERLGQGVRPSPGDFEEVLTQPVHAVASAQGAALVEQSGALASDLSQLQAGYPAQLPPIPLFSELGSDDFARVLDALRLVRRGPGDVILREGSAGTAFYVLARGSVRVTRATEDGGEQELATLGDGAVRGGRAAARGRSC